MDKMSDAVLLLLVVHGPLLPREILVHLRAKGHLTDSINVNSWLYSARRRGVVTWDREGRHHLGLCAPEWTRILRDVVAARLVS